MALAALAGGMAVLAWGVWTGKPWSRRAHIVVAVPVFAFLGPGFLPWLAALAGLWALALVAWLLSKEGRKWGAGEQVGERT